MKFGVASGTSPTTFNPTGDVSRAQMATFVAQAIAATGTALPTNPPDAVTDDDGVHDHMAWFMYEAFEAVTGAPLADGPDAFDDDGGNPQEQAINALAARGVLSGTGGGVFAPSSTVSRAQVGSFLARFLQLLDEAGAFPG